MVQLNEIFNNIFVITMKDSVRESRIKKRFESLNYEIFYGVDGTKVDKQYYESKGSKLTYGQLGCTLSHVNLYKKIVDENIEMSLILEDDCIFNDNIKNFEMYYNSLPQDWDVVYVGYLSDSMISKSNIDGGLLNKIELVKLDNGRYHTGYGHVSGTHAIIINNRFAKEMYEFNKDGLYTADGAFTGYLKEKGGNMYAFVPSMAIQDGIECLSVNVDKEMVRTTGSHVKYMEKK